MKYSKYNNIITYTVDKIASIIILSFLSLGNSIGFRAISYKSILNLESLLFIVYLFGGLVY